MNNIEVICRVIVKRGEQVLLCKTKSTGCFYLPGGHVEFGDSTRKTVYKEFEEEMGIKEDQILNLKHVDILENLFVDKGKERHEVDIIFTADLPEDLEVKSQEDLIDFEWHPISELENIDFLPKPMIEKVITNIGR